jgi:hypothetical protein
MNGAERDATPALQQNLVIGDESAWGGITNF